MSIISEALNSLIEETGRDVTVNIQVTLEPDLEEELLSGIKGDTYDEQSIEEWFDFTANVESIISNFGDSVEVSMSDNPTSLSEYISFFPYDKDGNLKHYIFNLRVSDHSIRRSGKIKRQKELSKLSNKWKVKSVTVNNKTFTSYSQALTYIRKLLADDLMNS